LSGILWAGANLRRCEFKQRIAAKARQVSQCGGDPLSALRRKAVERRWTAARRAIGSLAVGAGIDPGRASQRMVALLIDGPKYGAPRQGERPA
jgi:hypothetical protein